MILKIVPFGKAAPPTYVDEIAEIGPVDSPYYLAPETADRPEPVICVDFAGPDKVLCVDFTGSNTIILLPDFEHYHTDNTKDPVLLAAFKLHLRNGSTREVIVFPGAYTAYLMSDDGKTIDKLIKG